MRSKEREPQSGQALILIALLLIALLGLLGLVLDGGRVFGARRSSQNAADAAAFAGVRILASRTVAATESAVWDAVVTYAQANGVTNTADVVASFISASKYPDGRYVDICLINQNCGGVIPGDATGVRVTTTMQVEPFFINILIGNTPVPVPAVAAAQSGSPSVGTELMPMALKFPCPYPPPDPVPPECSFHYGEPAIQLYGNPDPMSSGGFGWISFDGRTDVPDLVDYLALAKSSRPILVDKADRFYNAANPTDYNWPLPPDPNPWVTQWTGNSGDVQVQKALDCWLVPSGRGCWPPPTHYPGDRNWIIPVFDKSNSNTGSGSMYHTVMLAKFEFRGYWFGNNQCNWFGMTAMGDCKNNPPGSLSPDLLPCFNTGQKCLMGVFLGEVTDLELYVSRCNSMGLDICAIGLAQ